MMPHTRCALRTSFDCLHRCQQVPIEEGFHNSEKVSFHDTFSLFHHSPLAHQSHAAEGEASTPKADQPPSYNLWGPSTAVQQAPLPLLHVVR